MLYKLIALARGFREAWDYDESPALLVVWRGSRRDSRGAIRAKAIHFSGPDAWRKAALS